MSQDIATALLCPGKVHHSLIANLINQKMLMIIIQKKNYSTISVERLPAVYKLRWFSFGLLQLEIESRTAFVTHGSASAVYGGQRFRQ